MRFGITLVLCAILSTAAWSVCEEPRPRLVCAEYFKSQAVVTAKLLHIKHVAGKEVDGYLYEMETDKAFRGDLGLTFSIYEENSSGRSTFDWKPGRPYLLFLQSYSNRDRGWVLDGCGNSGPLEQADAALKQIEGISGQHGGMIQVMVGGNWTSYSPPFKGARVSARSSEHTYSGTTDEGGQANVQVAAGHYTVTVAGDRIFKPFELSYENPNKVIVEDGSCAQIQFVAEQAK